MSSLKSKLHSSTAFSSPICHFRACCKAAFLSAVYSPKFRKHFNLFWSREWAMCRREKWILRRHTSKWIWFTKYTLLCIFIFKIANEMAALDTGYILKHVEAKPGSQIPWSIRQMGIYQSYSTSTKTSSSLLLQSSARVQKFIFDLAQDGGITQVSNHWTHLHEIYLGTMSSGWTDYIKLLDEKVSDIVSKKTF